MFFDNATGILGPMAKKNDNGFWKIVGFDILAVFCFIGVILFGWLPGPGGIPLFLLGLSLLAVNHDWAERWLETAKVQGVSFKKWLFPNNPWIQSIYDGLSLGVMGIAAILIFQYEERLIEGIAVILFFSSMFIFLVNRDRFGSVASLVKKLKRKVR